MKVLYISGGKGADYQCDVVFHGLRSLLGPDCVDVAKLYFMYDTSPDYMFHSLYKLLPDIEVDREDIEGKIRSKYFDGVVYGSVHRSRDLMSLVVDNYPPNKIVFIDGEDGPELAPAVGHGWYFKRELYAPHPDVLPIQFGIPKEKIRLGPYAKQRVMSPLIPGDYSTYTYYDSETRYYDQYSESYFGRTRKKGGWDCMRHYEIMAAGALPYFEGLEDCPDMTMFWLPKPALKAARRLHDKGLDPGSSEWSDIFRRVQDVLRRDLTTEAIATRILDRLQ